MGTHTEMVTNGLLDTTSCSEILNGIGVTPTQAFLTVQDEGRVLANIVRLSQWLTDPTNVVTTINAGGIS